MCVHDHQYVQLCFQSSFCKHQTQKLIHSSAFNDTHLPYSVTKECVLASVLFLCERLGYISVPHPFIYFGVVIFFVYYKLSSQLLGLSDPSAPFENLFCALFMGGMADAMRRAVATEQTSEEDKDGSLRNDVMKSKEEKKKD